ncbi:acetyl-CoA carboxylase biotin carboxyl carrier protein [bacterium]|jgi:acetyl-CoA carboxylase biotin carboxyl carrier protein|nr:acetyl-CoA carboxylase biotin carboxyl carrier protein [bacterium]MBR1619020.1 acetyl-CoA carboxylase biotin carboxyl carrier protein [bacterium]
MKFETDYIEKLAKIIKEQDLSEISLEDGEQAITIRKDVIVSSAPAVAISTPAVQPVSAPASAPIEAPSEAKEEKKSGTPITSPMVGTFYMAPSPDSAPFVSVGGSVKQGDVVCIIEAMKMMNEIKSEVAGKVVEVCVEDGQPVEFGQVLMYVE